MEPSLLLPLVLLRSSLAPEAGGDGLSKGGDWFDGVCGGAGGVEPSGEGIEGGFSGVFGGGLATTGGDVDDGGGGEVS